MREDGTFEPMNGPAGEVPSRRQFLEASLGGFAALLRAVDAETASGVSGIAAALESCGPDPLAGGVRVETVPFSDAGSVRFGTLEGRGLDARLLTDLSSLGPDTLVTPNNTFYVRTAYPDGLEPRDPWTISIGGLVRRPVEVALPALVPQVSPRGLYVMECAGNSLPGQFGLISAARWSGVPMADVLARVEPLPQATRVLVSGFDRHTHPSYTSSPGASWIFTFDDLRSSGAFLATEMNGQPLPTDHGYPVRLYVPRWYGCACIKWVNEISLVDDDAPSTPQMREFGPRTFQNGRPALAREFKPAAMDVAAMPVRIEKWRLDGRVVYRVIGIIWGGSAVTDRLAIRFNSREEFVPVNICPKATTTDTWSLWSCVWRPTEAGRYRIVLRVMDPSVRTERLDSYYYTREVRIGEV